MTNQSSATQEQTAGQLLSFTIGELGKLTLVGNISSSGADPAHATTLSSGREVVVMDVRFLNFS